MLHQVEIFTFHVTQFKTQFMFLRLALMIRNW